MTREVLPGIEAAALDQPHMMTVVAALRHCASGEGNGAAQMHADQRHGLQLSPLSAYSRVA